MIKSETEKQKLHLLSYFYNKNKFESDKKQIDEFKEKIPKILIEFLEPNSFWFTIYSQRKPDE